MRISSFKNRRNIVVWISYKSLRDKISESWNFQNAPLLTSKIISSKQSVASAIESFTCRELLIIIIIIITIIIIIIIIIIITACLLACMLVPGVSRISGFPESPPEFHVTPRTGFREPPGTPGSRIRFPETPGTPGYRIWFP